MTTNTSVQPHDEIRNALSVGRSELLARVGFSETDTREILIAPFLEYLGFPASHRRSEYQDDNNRPDEVIYDRTVSSVPSGGYCQIIMEAKPLNTDFDKGSERDEIPDKQIQRYLQNHAASGSGSYGVLTDGVKYRVYRKVGSQFTDINYVGDYNALEASLLDQSDPVHALVVMLHRDAVSVEDRSDREPSTLKPARTLVRAIANGKSPTEILGFLVRDRKLMPVINDELNLSGRALFASQNYWEATDWDYGCKISTEQMALLDNNRPVVAVIRFETDAITLTRGDVALAARTFARLGPTRMSVLIAYQSNTDGVIDKARVAVHYRGHTGMTTEFDPENPSRLALRSLVKLRGALRSSRPVTVERLTKAVAVSVIRNEFYEAIANWTKAKQAGRSVAQRQAVLRHLIRTVFAWILKENDIISYEPFEEWFAAKNSDNYHQQVVAFLFHERLNTPLPQRSRHHIQEIDDALASSPFLNGSIFAEHPDDPDLSVSYEEYFGVELAHPGLFTIMSRYRWTIDEHTPGESEQTIDPEMLSHLFENLVVATEVWQTEPDRMPEGTYYTPADIATEMVKDALVAAIRVNTTNNLTDQHLRDLFSDPDIELPNLTSRERQQIRNTIRNLTIYDPSVGSGEFPLIATNALRMALLKLGDDDDRLTSRIIQTQIYGQDINPMATQITRLRLFIAILSAERGRLGTRPLPNLEGRIVCANTLDTIADPRWRPEMTGELLDINLEIKTALTRLASIRREWLDAHTEIQKQTVRARDSLARSLLINILEETGNADHREMSGFANHLLLEPGAGPASTDARLLFYDPNWRGFDVVIGNPPYQNVDSIERERFRLRKRYTTTKGGNLYNLFCEVALTLVKSENGVVTLVVPHSLAFGGNKVSIRKLFVQRCKSIQLRHQDNRPDKTFHESPVKHPENRQRTTTITAVTGEGRPIIETTGVSNWEKPEREQFLQYRSYTRIPSPLPVQRAQKIAQWPFLPSERISRLVAEMAAQKRTVDSLSAKNNSENKVAVVSQLSAYRYVTSVPTGKLDRGEKPQPTVGLSGEDELELAMAALNGHAAFVWWKVWGDVYHVKRNELASVAIPDKWLDDPDMNVAARILGRNLIDAITPENIFITKSGANGGEFENVNFYESCPDTIERIDQLYLGALGMEVEPLLSQLHRIRSSSNWRI